VEILFICLVGAILGSCLNVLILRVRKGMTLLGRSRCVHCDAPLQTKHLVPIISWLVLRGRCGFCQRAIHIQYPLVEIAAMILLSVAYIRHPFFVDASSGSAFLLEAFMLLLFLVLAIFDLRWKIVPMEPIMVGTFIALVWRAVSGVLSPVSLAEGVLFGGLFLGAQVWLSRGRSMGEGDPWFGMLMGAFLGWPLVGVALYLTYVGGGVVLLLLWIFGIIRRGTHIPFVPFLALGTFWALLAGPMIEAWMRSLV